MAAFMKIRPFSRDLSHTQTIFGFISKVYIRPSWDGRVNIIEIKTTVYPASQVVENFRLIKRQKPRKVWNFSWSF